MAERAVPVDVRIAGYDVFPSSVEVSVTFLEGSQLPDVSFVLNGATVIERAAAKVSGKKFVIPTKFLAMDHTGNVPSLGGPVSLGLVPGTAPQGEVSGAWNPADNSPVFPVHSVFRQVAVRLETVAGPFDLAATDVSAEISSIPPAGVSYSHPAQIAVMKGSTVVGKAKAKHVLNGNGGGDHGKQPCAPCCTVEAHGHCSRFLVKDKEGLQQQLLFVASHPGVAASPVERDRVLVYKTITNDGPRAVRVYWDGPPPLYEIPAQSALLLPGNSLTVAAGRAIKVVYSPDPNQGLSGDQASGHDVISWCCPDPWVSKPER